VRRSISRILTDRATTAPDDVVVIDADGELTAGELAAAAARLAHVLRDNDVGVDDLVTVSLPNTRDFVIACAAVWMAGATPQPLATTVSDDERAAVDRVARPAASIGRPPVGGGIASIPGVDPDPTGNADAARSPLPDLAASSWKAPTTSGSTGSPKIVKAAAPALLDPTQPVAAFLPMNATQLVSGPLTHSASFTYAFRGLFTGHRLVLLPRFEERSWLGAVEAHHVTWALLVPTMMHRLLRLPAEERPTERLVSLETVLHMGAPCAPDLKRRFLSWVGPDRVLEVYAGTESNGLTMIRGDEWLRHPGSVGRPIGGTELQIRGPSGAVVATGDPGTIWMRRGARPAYHYVGAASRRGQDGWDTLGDVGFLDREGFLHVVDRADDVINRASDKIYPIEIERVLEQHPSVGSAVAFGLPDPEFGQIVGAVVEATDASVTSEMLSAWTRARLGARSPQVIRIVDTPLRNDAGKVSRRRWAHVVGGGGAR
jgi:bile acid-coenzyme A ligase